MYIDRLPNPNSTEDEEQCDLYKDTLMMRTEWIWVGSSEHLRVHMKVDQTDERSGIYLRHLLRTRLHNDDVMAQVKDIYKRIFTGGMVEIEAVTKANAQALLSRATETIHPSKMVAIRWVRGAPTLLDIAPRRSETSGRTDLQRGETI